jgi:hypothetical protein
MGPHEAYCACKYQADATEATLHRVYVQFGRGLIDEYGDSVDFLVDTKPFEGGIEYAPAPEIERLRAENHQAFMNGAAVVLRDLILAYDQPTMAKNIVKSLGLEPVDFQDCDPADYRAIRREGGMLKCSGKWFSDKVANNGESQDYDRWFSCEDSPMCEIHGCDSNECRCEPPK